MIFINIIVYLLKQQRFWIFVNNILFKIKSMKVTFVLFTALNAHWKGNLGETMTQVYVKLLLNNKWKLL